ncbi:MAG: hypothetical protein J1F02_09735 [Lachnospiraceae bacterium]|nr:hypothetical protein [Lachnospiraceae bacterium]
MRTRNNKLINFILEFSQIILVFLGVFSALMCTAFSLSLTFDRGICALVMLLGSILFYGLFTVLETFRNGKLYGILGITLFYLLIGYRFFGAVKKGFVTIVNSFLKEFMNYSGSSLPLMSYTDTESASTNFCTTLILVLLGIYLIAIISAFFYRRRRSMVFLVATIPFAVLPLVVGRMGFFSNLVTYLIVAVVIVGTRHMRTDATDRRMRQKLSLILMVAGLAAGVISYVVIPPERYERNEGRIVQMKNSLVALSTWSADEVFDWIKAYFSDDAIDYGRLGKRREITYTGKTMLKMSGQVYKDSGMYLKGYVGDIYESNRWSSLTKEDGYSEELQAMEDSGSATPDNWHVRLRNELGDAEATGKNVWRTSKLHIRNMAFGYGNYVMPYLPLGSFKYEGNGRITIDTLGIDYMVEYYSIYPVVMRQDLLSQDVTLANVIWWGDNQVERQQLTDFVKKYYLQVPESLEDVQKDFLNYLKQRGDLLTRYESGTASEADIIQEVKRYITRDTEYSLSPGRTPSGRDTVEYFLTEGKKGYCTYYATTATMLLRSAGIPARYVEGMYVPKEQLADCTSDQEIAIPDNDAHAWVEVWHEQYGFVPVEVTPGFGEDDAQATDSSYDTPPEEPADNPGSSGATPVPSEVPETVTPTPSVTETPEESMTFDDIDGNEDEEEEETGESGTDGGNASDSTAKKILGQILEILKILVPLLLVLAAIEGQRRIRRKLFARNLRNMKMKKRIRRAHYHIARIFVRRGVVYRGQAMWEYTREIARAMELPEEDIYEYVSLVYYARFGPDDITEEQMPAFREIYEAIRKKAYGDAKWWKKLYYMYILVL